MVDSVKISQLPVATEAAATDVFVVNQAGVTKQISGAVLGNLQTIATAAQLRNTPPQAGRTIYLKGYYADNDGGEGVFEAADNAPAGTYTHNGGTVITPIGGDGSAAWLRSVHGPMSIKWFGAKGDGAHDDTAAFNAWIAAVIGSAAAQYSGGGCGYIPTGFYYGATPWVIDLNNARATGIRLFGDGPRRSVFYNTYTAGTPFSITNTNAVLNYFYSCFEGFGFQGAVNGTLVALGDVACEGNGIIWRNITVNNTLNGAVGKGLVITKFYASTFDNLTVNCGAGGTGATTIGVELNEVAFCNFNSVAIGQCRDGLVLNSGASGYIFGNTFDNIDVEECVTPLIIQSANASKNAFVGGTLAATNGSYAVDATAGFYNTFYNVNFTGGGGFVRPFNNNTGVINQLGNTVTEATSFDYTVPNLRWFSYGSANTPLLQSFAALGTPSAPTTLTAQWQVGTWIGSGYNGTNYQQNARIDLVSSGAPPTTTSSPGQILFYTTPSASITPTLRVTINPDGHVLPGADNAQLLGANGQRWSAVWAATGTIQTSDARTKTDVENLSAGLDFIDKLRPVSYRFITGGNRVLGQNYYDAEGNIVLPGDPNFAHAKPGDLILEPIPGTRTHWGFIAQEVKTACDDIGVVAAPWVLSDLTDPNSEQGLRANALIPPLVKAVQELAARVRALESQ